MEIIFVIIGIVLYFIPSFIGSDRKDSVWIFLFNLFLGWTIVCWLIAIVWALTADKAAPPVIHTHTTINQNQSAVDQIMKLSILKEKGAITESEFEREKQKILSG